MPELPEVETIRQRISPLLLGKTITKVVVQRPDVVGFPEVAKFKAGLKDKTIVQIGRRGKYLLLFLSDNKILIIHLRLSGHLRVITDKEKPDYERVRFGLNDRTALVFIEPRALGRVYLVTPAEIPSILKGLTKMGREPIEENFNANYLYSFLKRRKAKIKTVLLDQRVCAGVGNIYSDEALFLAKINPNRPANSLNWTEVQRLSRALKLTVKNGIKFLGTTMSDQRYLLPDGTKGRFQKRLKVFRCEGKSCPTCGKPIIRTRIGNRSSYFCPICQI